MTYVDAILASFPDIGLNRLSFAHVNSMLLKKTKTAGSKLMLSKVMLIGKMSEMLEDFLMNMQLIRSLIHKWPQIGTRKQTGAESQLFRYAHVLYYYKHGCKYI